MELRKRIKAIHRLFSRIETIESNYIKEVERLKKKKEEKIIWLRKEAGKALKEFGLDQSINRQVHLETGLYKAFTIGTNNLLITLEDFSEIEPYRTYVFEFNGDIEFPKQSSAIECYVIDGYCYIKDSLIKFLEETSKINIKQ